MESKKQQGIIVPLVVVFICFFAFGVPFIFSAGIDDSHDDIVLAPRFSPTPTPLDRILTQQAFANLFFTATDFPILVSLASPAATQTFIFIPVTGPTSTLTPTKTPSPTPTRTLISYTFTVTVSGAGQQSTPTRSVHSTNTAVIVQPFTGTPVVQDPPTETPVPEPTDPPPTDPPTEPPPPTDPPTGGN